MKKSYILLLASLLFLTITPLKAEPLRILPFVKGSLAEIKTQHQGKPFILVFWSESCQYCLVELAMLAKYQKKYPKMNLITVATDSFLEDDIIKRVLQQSQLTLTETWVFSEQFPEIIYADVNQRWRGELPVTHFFNQHHQEIRHIGIIKEDKLNKWLKVAYL